MDKNSISIKDSFLIINEHQLTKYKDQPHTLLITGPSRSGTSALAMSCKYLGYNLGEIDNVVHENSLIFKALNNNKKLSKIISENNAEHDNWGFKLPKATFYLSHFIHVLRRPIILVSYRNLISNIKSNLKRNAKFTLSKKDFNTCMYRNMDYLQTIFMAARNYENTPFVLVEYEKLLMNPSGFIDELSSELGITLDELTRKKCIESISTPGYKKFKS